MKEYAGYITDSNELFIFATSIENFCNDFKNGCKAVVNARESDISTARLEITRLKNIVAERESAVAQAQAEYNSYISQENYDASYARQLSERIEEAKKALEKAREDLRAGEQLFQLICQKLDEICSVAGKYANAVDQLGNDAVRVIRHAAGFISQQYNP